MQVFISSTSEDLESYRAAARDVVLDLGWHPVMMEHFGADGELGVVRACRRRVLDCDVVLAILAWRRGGVPGVERGGDGKASYTEWELKARRGASLLDSGTPREESRVGRYGPTPRCACPSPPYFWASGSLQIRRQRTQQRSSKVCQSRGGGRQIAAAFSALSDADDRTAYKAATRLREIGDAETVEPLVSILRAEELEQLIWLQDARQADDLSEDEIADIERDAPLAYWMLGDQSAWGGIDLRSMAAYALAGILSRVTASEVVDPLIETLTDPEPDIRWNVVEALGHLGSSRALPHLERLAESDESDSTWGLVADAARTAIRRIERAQTRARPWD